MLLIGLAVGVDYSMFYLRREREERAKGRSERAALEVAAATSGRSVLISGLTVITAMAGMFLTGDKAFASFGVATILVVAIAMLGSLTVLPALLSRLGDRVDRRAHPAASDGSAATTARAGSGAGSSSASCAGPCCRRPSPAGLLVGLAIPALQLRMVMPGPDTFPKSLPVVQTYDEMQQAFPGSALPANVVVKAPDVTAPRCAAAIRRLEQRALATGRMHEPITVEVNKDATVANITVPIEGKGTDAGSKASLAALRNEIVPETVGALPNAEAGVTGLTARWTRPDGRDEVEACCPSSRSSSCSRSCSCSSPSGRS